MDNDIKIERVIRFSVNGREFTSMEDAYKEMLRMRIARILKLNFEGISSNWEHNLYNKILDNMQALASVMNG